MRGTLFLYFIFLLSTISVGQTIYVSPTGKDSWNGTDKRPVATFGKAQQLAHNFASNINVEVIFEDGTYYLPETILFDEKDCKDYPVTVIYRARNEGRAIISGGQCLTLKWMPHKKGIYVADVPQGTIIDQLYINGKRQQMARFPNASSEKGKNVYDSWVLTHKAKGISVEDPLNPERIAKWKNPTGGYLHAMHSRLWGDMHWLIQGKKGDDSLSIVGGWQNNRPDSMHPLYRMVENIKEELDIPGEWFYDKKEGKLYLMPMAETDIHQAKVEIVRLKHLIEFQGSKNQAVTGVHLNGFVFKHTSRTFMENKEPLLRSDWTIYRGGAILYNGAEDCILENCEFDQVGGNTIFVNNYNRRIIIRNCYIHDSGANGVAFVGDPSMVRSPLFRYGQQDYTHIDRAYGPKGDNYPQDCLVENCLITMTGRDEKQTAPIQISMSHRIRVSHCSIYDVPRAGININEGTWGGHIIEYCDVFNTVLETGDHGSFNSWGRDRYWTPNVKQLSKEVTSCPDMPYWDMLEPNVIRNNRWRCDHGWDIDLDDGSTWYRIYNNLLLNGGLKLREGYDRIVTNNIILNNSLHPHVWLSESGDVFKHNIVFEAYHPAAMQSVLSPNDKWGKELDDNLFVSSKESMNLYRENGADWHSITGDPMFIDGSKGDFRVAEHSPAIQIGFQNFDMDQFGVRSKKLKAIARKPAIPAIVIDIKEKAITIDKYSWMGAFLKVPQGDELSAYGVSFDQTGVAFERVSEASEAANIGFRSGDLILNVNGVRITNFKALESYIQNKMKNNTVQKFQIVRDQKIMIMQVKGVLDKLLQISSKDGY